MLSFSFRSRGPGDIDPQAVRAAVDVLKLPEAVYKTCPWQPRELVERGLRQWLLCCGAALRDDQVIGMPSHAVDEAWHGFILCTERYAEFCATAYGRFLHHFPEGAGPPDNSHGTAAEQLGRTVVAWSLMANAGETCVLWDLDRRVGVRHPWGIEAKRIADIEAELTRVRTT
ncbi:glycine-rich domain-containing protein [Nocardia sp. 004]|uniref:glycine-rich domain-containing protein n=1 Tax=Nocardia sp. 004 TaxID=3385978 RepID=UPI00399F00D5